MSLSSMKSNGYIEVAKTRQDPPVKIYYELHGDGPQHVVLIMGLNASCLNWEKQTKYLAETGKYTVLIFENRGMGLSDAPKGLYSTSQMAHDVIDLMDHLGWKDHVHVDGISMGGMIALELVSTWPERFSSLVLTSTTSGRQIPPWKAVTTLPRMMFISDPKTRIGAALDLVYPPSWLDSKPTEPDFVQFETNRDMSISLFLARMDRSRPQTLTGNLGQTAACLRHYVSDERLLKIKAAGIPCLVVTGTWDNLVNPKNSYHLSRVLGCPIEIFEGSGHSLPGEQPVRYNRLIDTHFTQASKGQ
ncbi:putative aminoacrylate hydrolase RutD [Choanephora cucurbitarum]|uniref:Putative aminoacrylate hydrolase RutD n=1 Tax=Choanephora cucurbitarum TaxID=101091 RepID=A0A1C7NLR3_9FUNG|nr:putative aminoacrylate hydrolase RutD [Choanephora cucurbitarum]